MADVFISYKSERRAAARHLEQILRLHGYSVWFDHALVRGEDYEEQIQRQIEAASAVVVMWCGRSVASAAVRSEAGYAKARKKQVPLKIEPCELPLFSTLSHYIDLTKASCAPSDPAFRAVLADVERLVGRAPQIDTRQLKDYERSWRAKGARTLSALPLDAAAGPEIVLREPPAPDPPRPGEAHVAAAAQAWPDVRDSRDPARLLRFERHFAGTYFAEEARELREAIESENERERAAKAAGLAEQAARAKTEQQRLKPIRTFAAHDGGFWKVAFSPDGRLALSVGTDNTVRLWEVATGAALHRYATHVALEDAAFTPDGGTVYIANFMEFKLWDVVTGQILRSIPAPGSIGRFAISPDGRTILSGHWSSSKLHLIAADSGKELRSFSEDWVSGFMSSVRSPDRGAFSIAYAQDGRTALTAHADHLLRLWDLSRGSVIRTFKGHKSRVNSVAYARDGRYALSGGSDGTVRLWDVASGQLVRTFSGHTTAVVAADLSPDGRTAVSASVDKTIRLWEVATGRELRTIMSYKFDCVPGSIIFAPDGQTFLAGGVGRIDIFDAGY